MVKIIINGEHHNSELAPKIAIQDSEILKINDKNVIFALEDTSVIDDFDNKIAEIEEFLNFVSKIQKIKSIIRDNNPALLTRIEQDEELSLSKSETAFIKSITTAQDLTDNFEELISYLQNIDEISDSFGGQTRTENYLDFLKHLSNFDRFAIDDEESVSEIYQLKKSIMISANSRELESLTYLLNDPEIEKKRCLHMAKEIFDKAKILTQDSIIYVYPIGNSHVAEVYEQIIAKATEENIEIEVCANLLWDNKQKKQTIIESEPNQLISNGEVKEFFLSDEESNHSYQQRFGEIFPNLQPKKSASSSSAKQIKYAEKDHLI